MDWPLFTTILWKAVVVMVLVLLNGFFVAAEFALVKIRETQLATLISQGNRSAKRVRKILRNLDSALSAAQLGITLASLGLGWVGEPIFAEILKPVYGWMGLTESEHKELRHTISFIVGFSVITFLHITAGEQAPKWLAIQKPLPVSLWVARPLSWFQRIASPLIWVLNQSSLWMLRRFGLEVVSEHELHHSEEELRLLIAGSPKAGTAGTLGHDIVLNALDLRRRVARDVMRPRREIVALDSEASIADSIDLAEKSRYSRFPIMENEDLDRTLGVVHIKDLYAMRMRAQKASDLLPHARKIIYVPESARLEKVLQLFLDRKSHLAMVVDEYGGTTGMVTLENILETLVGQIQDEFDQEKPLIEQKDPNHWELEGALPLHELEDLVGQMFSQEGVTTTSGWVTQNLGGFPKVGDQIEIGQFVLQVEAMAGTQVARMSLSRIPAPSDETSTVDKKTDR